MEDLDLFQRLGLATAIGFVVGVERGWRHRFAEDESRVAGLRTHTLIGLFGGLSGAIALHLGVGSFIALAAIFGLAWGTYKFWETVKDGDLSITGLMAGLLTFALGAYCIFGSPQIATACGVGLVAVMAFKQATHDWLKALTWEEIRSALLILVATYIALPLLPDRALDPYGAFNPRELWLLTIVVAAAGFAGYVALRMLGERAGLFVGAAAGALVSSTIVTIDLARRAKKGEVASLQAAAAAALANFVMFARVGVLIAVFAAPALATAAPAVAAACAVSLCAAGLFAFLARKQDARKSEGVLGSPLDIREVARFALILSVITVGAKIVAHFYGDAGLIAFAATAGLVDVDAVSLAVGGQVRGGLDPHSGAEAILLAAAVNTLSKTVLGVTNGGARFAGAYGGAALAALAAAAATFALIRF
jgi:uncharacterized membrane protein (DUF4010 family)